MDSDNNKKITWTRSTAKKPDNSSQNDVSLGSANQNTSSFGDENVKVPPQEPSSVSDIADRAANYTANTQSSGTSDTPSIDDLRGEIDAALSSSMIPTHDPAQTIVQPRDERLVDLDASDHHIIADSRATKSVDAPVSALPITPKKESSVFDEVGKDNHETLVSSLREDIASEIENAKPSAEKKEKPVDQTYYSDLSKAMSSNEPATMSELIRKSQFEEEEKKVFSPKSRKNLFFIAGAIILLLLSVGILSTLFTKEKTVKFITEERVSSLVRSNLDTGINTTGLDSSRIKRAIRDVTEMKIPEGSINQIYYVQDDGLGNYRRLGVKDVFEKTDNQTPTVLYDNIDSTFTNGVYRGNKNYPFIIMKALSYDRALVGMMEWEATMIDDLATYLDLPPEATDRSLIQEGFEDDLIKNKNVRVARFLPREVDGRGILDILRINPVSEPEPEPEAANEDGQFEITDDSIDLGGETGGFFDRLFARAVSPAYAQQGAMSFDDAIDGGTNLDDFRVAPVCFDKESGVRLPFIEEQEGPAADRYCFESYRCYRYSCFVGNTEVGLSGQDQPGAVCRDVTEEGPVYLEGDLLNPGQGFTGQKSCYQFNELMALSEINNTVLCFSKSGQYIPNYAPRALDRSGYNTDGVTCLAPQDRGTLMCVDESNRVYIPTDGSTAGAQFCFDPNGDLGTQELGGINPDCHPQDPTCNFKGFTSNQCSEIELGTDMARERLLQAAYQLRFVANTASLLGLSNSDTSNLREAAIFLEKIAFNSVLSIPEIEQGAVILQNLEMIMNRIDQTIVIPTTKPDGSPTFYGRVRSIINIIQCILGTENATWVSGELIPQGVSLYAGYTGPDVLPVQQTLAIIGLLNPDSITGTVDLVTQDAASQLQIANGLEVTGILDEDTLEFLLDIVQGRDNIYGDTAIINDYLPTTGTELMSLGSYNENVQVIQIILFNEGYAINNINGLFDETMCAAVQSFQEDNDLELADSNTCELSLETIDALNDIIREESLLGSGFILNEQGFLEGTGELETLYGPGVANFEVNEADADSLNEGDIVLMYMFLDEETILITRDEIVINEVIRRRALEDIFGN